MLPSDRISIFTTAILVVLMLGISQAKALSDSEYQGRLERLEFLVENTDISREQAQDLADEAWGGHFDEQKDAGVQQIGQPFLNGIFPVGNVSPGVVGLLTFAFIDTQTMQPVTRADVGFVAYDIKLNSEVSFTELGLSVDPETNFSLPFDFTFGIAPLIRATPYSISGDPIFIPGVNGENTAIGLLLDIPRSVPEPASLTLLVSSLLVSGMLFRIKRMRKYQS